MADNQPHRKGVALVTGASTGIGADLAELLAQDGYDLILVARSEGKLDALAAKFRTAYKVVVHIYAMDLTTPAAVQRLVDRAHADHLAVEVLLNNAGFGAYGPFAENMWEAERDMIQLNIFALTELTKRLLPGMLARQKGRILNVASTAAFQPGPLMAVYYATKAYVLSFSEALANELSGSGVTVTCLCPGPTQTEFQARAAMEGSKLVRNKKLMSSRRVAQIGYRAMQRGKSLSIPGLMNKLLTFTVRCTPRRWVTAIVRRLQEKA